MRLAAADNDAIKVQVRVETPFSEHAFQKEPVKKQKTSKYTRENPFTETFAANHDTRKQKPRFVILQDNKLKVVWDVYVMLILITVTIIIPYRLAFSHDDVFEW